MKNYCWIGMLALFFSITPATLLRAQSQEAQQLLLNMEKLAQLKSILSKMKQGYQVISQGYDKIKALSKGNFDLHKTFLDGLLAVSPAVRQYRKAAAVVTLLQSILKECRTSSQAFISSQLLSTSEHQYLDAVQKNIRNLSLKHLEEFTMVMTAGKLRMSDGERLEAIDRIYAVLQDKLAFIRQFNNSNRLLLAGRKLQQYEVNTSRRLHEITP